MSHLTTITQVPSSPRPGGIGDISHLAQPLDPVGGFGMGRKQLIHRLAIQWIDNKHMRGGRIGFGFLVVYRGGALFQLVER